MRHQFFSIAFKLPPVRWQFYPQICGCSVVLLANPAWATEQVSSVAISPPIGEQVQPVPASPLLSNALVPGVAPDNNELKPKSIRVRLDHELLPLQHAVESREESWTKGAIAPPESMPHVAELRRDPSSYQAATLGSPWQIQLPTLSPEASNPIASSPNPEISQTQKQPDSTPTSINLEPGNPNLQDQPEVVPSVNPPPTSPPADEGAPTSAQPECPEDPELGLPCIPTEPVPPPPLPAPRQPVVYLIPRLDYFRSTNIFAALDAVEDSLFRPGLTLFAVPQVGPNTYLIGSINGNLVRYSNETEFDYNELQFKAGVFQELSPRMSAEFSWTNQQLFIAGDDLRGLSEGERFFNDHALRLELSRRDSLGPKLGLNTSYQFRLSFADPSDRSRITNTLLATLNYEIQPNLRAGLSYQFIATDFTRREREDLYHQVLGQLTYTMFRNTRLTVFAGYSFGSSTESDVDFNSLILGVSLGVTLGLF